MPARALANRARPPLANGQLPNLFVGDALQLVQVVRGAQVAYGREGGDALARAVPGGGHAQAPARREGGRGESSEAETARSLTTIAARDLLRIEERELEAGGLN